MKFSSVILGGTFDRLHNGHQALLSKAFSIGEKVTIGVTTDTYVKTFKHASFLSIAPFSSRVQALTQWLTKRGWHQRVLIVPLNDSYGPSVDGAVYFDAIVVTSQTRSVAEKINTIRAENALLPLTIIEVPMVPAQDFQHISSTRVRSGEIDVTGRLTLPDNLRPELKKSIGDIIGTSDILRVLKADGKRNIVTVGDMTTEKVLGYGIKPILAIIDLQMVRKPFLWETELFQTLLEDSIREDIQSGPGYISSHAIQAIQRWAKLLKNTAARSSHTVFLIDGEEDLLILPVLCFGSLGAVVYYRQPREGMVRVFVSKEKQTYAQELMKKFTLSV
jgi:pantetheine-phosphate adenylyltransferase